MNIFSLYIIDNKIEIKCNGGPKIEPLATPTSFMVPGL